MNILKILNINKNGIIDYKGLNINLFVADSQFYYEENNVENCLVKTEEHLAKFNNNDVIEITEEEYWNIIKNYKTELTTEEQSKTKEQKKIEQLEKDNINNMKAMVELHTKILALEGKL